MAEIGGQLGQTKKSRAKNIKEIKDWFNKAIKKGPVSTSQIEAAFPERSKVLIYKALGEANVKKLTRATPLQTKFTKDITKIINDVSSNKAPLINASPQKIFAKLYGKPFNAKTDNIGVIDKILKNNSKYLKIKDKVTNTSTRVGSGNKLFETIKLKDFDKASVRTKLPRVSGNIVEENILGDLVRHISRGGKDFKYIAGGRTNEYKTLKIKDVKNGDVLTFDKIKKAIKTGDPRFKEYNKIFNEMKDLKGAPYFHPVTGEKITLLKGLQLGTDITAPLHVQHNKGIVASPLKNLSISTHKANQGARMVKSKDDLKALGIRGTLPDGKRVYGPDIDLKGNINRFTKFADKMIKGSGTRTLKTPTETLTAARDKLITSTNKLSKPETLKFCSLLSNGGLPGDCKQALKADPEKAAKILSEAPVTSAAMKDVKGNAQKMIRLFRGEPLKSRTAESVKALAKRFNVSEAEAGRRVLQGQFFSASPDMARTYTDKLGKMKYVDVTPKEFQDMKRYVERINKTNDVGGKTRFPVSRRNDGNNIQIVPRRKLKQFEETGRMKSKLNIFGKVDTPEGMLKYDSVVGGFIDPKNPTQVINNAQIKTWAAENPMPVQAGTEDAFKPIKKNFLKTVGKTLAKVGAPLPTALLDSYFIGKQIQDDKPAVEIAKDPLNWLGLATMSTLTKVGGITNAGVATPGTMNTILRLGMSPAGITAISRLGYVGLAVSGALTAYDQYNKYQNEEGLIYNLFNDKAEPV